MGLNLAGAVLPAAQAATMEAAQSATLTATQAESTPESSGAPAGLAGAVQSSPMVATAMSAVQRPMGLIDRHVWKSVAANVTAPGAKEVALAMLAVNGGEIPPEALAGMQQLAATGVPAGVTPGVPAVEPVTPVAGAPAPAGAAGAAAPPQHAVEVLQLVNEARRAKGLAPLTLDPALAKVATAHSKKMAAAGKMAHDGIGDGNPADRIRKALPKSTHTAENVAAGQPTAAAVVKGWMDSPPHRENILRPEVRHIGVDMATAPDGTPYWTQVFSG